MKTTAPRLLCTLLSCLPAASYAGQVIISEVMYNPAGTRAEWIEVVNTTTRRMDMATWRLSGGASLTLPDFLEANPSAHLLFEHERILLSAKSPAETRVDYPSIPAGVRIYGPWVGALDNSKGTITILDKNGARLNELTYGNGGRKWPAAPDGTGHSLVMVNENRAVDDWHNWRASPVSGGSPGTTDVVPSEEVIGDPTAALPLTFAEAVPMTATWDYYKETAAPPVDWNALNFVVAAPWESGPALLGFETAALPAPGLVTGFGTPGLLTYYFRKSFTWNGGGGGAQFQMDTILDDGATFYMNGTYIGNKDGDPAPVHNTSVATVTVTDAVLVNNAVIGAIPPGVLVEGTNVLAAVSFQANATSSDMIFGANLRLGNAPPTELLINEVRQAGAGAGFIEFYNPGGVPINLNGFFLTDTSGAWTKFPITQSVMVPAGGLATLGFTESGFSATAASTTVFLARADGTPVTGLTAALPQDGRSVGRKPAGGSTWYRFSQATPGQPNSSAAAAGGGSVAAAFNEVHFDPVTGKADWVEFTNAGSTSQSLAGYFVASAKDFSDKVALTGAVSSHGFASVAVDFPTDNAGKLTLFLIDGGNTVLAEAKLQRKLGKSSSQAWPAGSGEWYATIGSTRDAANVPDRNPNIVISEIMYAPPSDHRQGEYIELYNRGIAVENVGGWTFDSGISYTIPTGTTIAPGARLVVAQNAAFITANYAGITGVVGDYGGSLSNSGELIRLVDTAGNLADEVDYHTGGDWPRAPDSLGSSLELINPLMDNDSGSSWAASDESQKGQWASFSHTGIYYGVGPLITPEIHFNLVGDGHIVVRNLVYGTQGTPGSALSTALSPLNSGIDGWRVTGTHWATFSSADGLHIVADGAGDMKGNAIELDVPQAANVGYTMTFQARWVSGLSRLILDSQDHTWGRTFAVPVPNNLGTPGAPNSRAVATAVPEIWSMLHSPAVPKVTDDVLITARVTSALPLASVSVVHRRDSTAGNGAWTTTPMNDAGTGGDVVAGDGMYSVSINAHKVEGAIAQFYIQASATGGGTATYPAGGVGTPGLWIVDSTPVTSDLLVQRFVVSAFDHDSMGTNGVTVSHNYRHPRMSNHYYNATFIVNEKEITYNVESRKSGSPWTRDTGNSMDRVRSKFPKDRLFRGREKTGADNDASDTGARRWNNDVDRYWLYLLGYPAAESEYIQVQFNNLGLALKEDTEPTDTDMLDRTYGNSGVNELHEIDDSWYFGDDLASENRGQVDGNWVYDARYLDNPVYWHASWPIRTQVERYDYSPITSWIRTMYNNAVTPADAAADATYRASVENQFDVDKFARYAAVKGWAGSWDNFTINRGKNGYVYRRPTDGRWEFEFWDGDLDFQNSGEAVLGGIGGTGVFFGRPWFRRQMNYYLQEIRDKWSLNSPRMYAWLQAMEDQSPSYTIDQNYYKNWFTNRRPTIDSFITNGGGNPTLVFSATASVGATTALHVTTLTGNAAALISTVTVDGHTEGVFSWLTGSTWQITGILLKNGTNTLTVRGWDRQGTQQGSAVVTVNKTTDAPPVLSIVTDPQSMNASVGEAVIVDSAASYDPEGTPLTLNWTNAPLTGITNTAAGTTGRRLLFTVPGIYTVTLSGTDGAGTPASITREITIFATSDFFSFGSGLLLSPSLTAANTELRDNNSPASWYSMEDVSGRLLLQINETAAAPLDSANFPAITRPLPAAAGWVLQTDARLDSRRLGESFNTGLLVDTVENGQPARYVYSIESGGQIRVRRADAATAFYGTTSGPVTPDPIYINCGGPQVTETDNKVWAADNYFLTTPATAIVTQTFNPTVGGASQYFGLIGDSRRSGVASGGIIYEIPVPVWASNYNAVIYCSTVAASTQTISMSVNINDAVTSSTFNANSSATIMRQLTVSSLARNANGKIKIAITRNATTTAGAEAGVSAIAITPIVSTPGTGLPPLTPAPMRADALRIQRSGNSLIFSREAAGVWIVDETRPLPAGATAVKGGIFASTETAMNLRASFDYLFVADPAQTSAILASLRLTELMYHPAADSVEYIEFQNTGAAPINLLNVSFPASAPFAAYSFGNETLAPGEFIVLTGNPSGFRQKYGQAPRLAISPWSSGTLDNGGEHVIVNDASGNNLHDFIYDDAAPWPLTPDGQGPSLEVIDVLGDYNNPLNWRASASIDGTPGGTTRLVDADTDGDGYPDWVEAAFGLPADSPSQKPAAAAAVGNDGLVTVTWPFAANRSYRVQASATLTAWQNVATVTGGSYTDPSGTSLGRRYYRVEALP